MLDIKFIRENADIIKEAARKKHVNFDVDALVALDGKRLELLSTVEGLRAQQNQASTVIAATENAGERNVLIAKMQDIKDAFKKSEEELRAVMVEWQTMMLGVPNVPDMSVPEGDTDEENMEVRVVGEKPVFAFAPKDHIALMESLDIADFERGTKVAGFRGYFLKGDAVVLEMALWQYAMDLLRKRGYLPMIVPSLVNRQTLLGTGYLPGGEEDLYKTQDGDYLAGTAEVATMSYYSGEIIEKEKLPMRIVAFSPCFRREAGSHSKDVKGLIRVHEFFKVEQVILGEASHEESVKLHEELAETVDQLLSTLKLHYHVVVNCGGDLGLGQVKKYDFETWMPSQEKFRETHSCSYFHDFQTRRLNIRYKDTDGKLRYAHSLNTTAVATPRILACIIEQYQQADGSIKIPEVLVPYIGKDKIEKR